jgi:hypothetical protein
MEKKYKNTSPRLTGGSNFTLQKKAADPTGKSTGLRRARD